MFRVDLVTGAETVGSTAKTFAGSGNRINTNDCHGADGALQLCTIEQGHPTDGRSNGCGFHDKQSEIQTAVFIRSPKF